MHEADNIASASVDFLLAYSFLRTLDPDATNHTFQTIDDVVMADGTKRAKKKLTRIRHGSLAEHFQELEQANEEGAGVYLTMNATDGRGRRAENIARIRVVWGDFDVGLPPAFALEPSILWQSSVGRFQAAWRVEGLTPQEHAGVLARIVESYGADPDADGINRILRLPGFLHKKRQPQLVTMVSDPGHIYTRDQILTAFPPASARTRSKPASPAPIVRLDVDEAVANAVAILQAAAPAIEKHNGEPHTFATACRVLDFGISEEKCLELMQTHWNDRCQPPWDAEELANKIANAAKHRQLPNGVASPLAEFEPFDAETLALIAKHTKKLLETTPAKIEDNSELFESATRWTGKEPLSIPYIVPNWVPRDCTSLLAAAGGRGKSMLALQLMIAVASGTPFLGLPIEQGSAAGIFCEDNDNALHRRAKAICAGQEDIVWEKVAPRLFPTSFVGRNAILWEQNKQGRGTATTLLEHVDKFCAAHPDLKLLVVDNVSFVYAALEYDRGQVTNFVNSLTGIAMANKLAVLLIHHESKTNKDNDLNAASGSTAWLNSARSVMKLTAVKDQPDKRTLMHLKSNESMPQFSISCLIGGDGLRALHSKKRDAALEIETQRLVKQATDARPQINLSTSGHAGEFYGPRWMAKHQAGGSRFSDIEFKETLKRLVEHDVIYIGTYHNGKKGKELECYLLRKHEEI